MELVKSMHKDSLQRKFCLRQTVESIKIQVTKTMLWCILTDFRSIQPKCFCLFLVGLKTETKAVLILFFFLHLYNVYMFSSMALFWEKQFRIHTQRETDTHRQNTKYIFFLASLKPSPFSHTFDILLLCPVFVIVSDMMQIHCYLGKHNQYWLWMLCLS